MQQPRARSSYGSVEGVAVLLSFSSCPALPPPAMGALSLLPCMMVLRIGRRRPRSFDPRRPSPSWVLGAQVMCRVGASSLLFFLLFLSLDAPAVCCRLGFLLIDLRCPLRDGVMLLI